MRNLFITIFLFMCICLFGQECAQTDIQQAYITFSTNEHITVSEAIYSLSDSKKVKFALGNLMYQPSTKTWKIADEQYDYVGGIYNGPTNDCDLIAGKRYGTIPGSDNAKNNSKTYTGWLDLFRFDTVQNIRIVTDTITYRVPTEEEFSYLVYNRTDASKLRGRARIIVNDSTFVNGLMLLPDTSVIQFIPHGKTFMSDYDGCVLFTHNVFTREEWKIIEAQGIVFLPACAARANSAKYNRSGFYWTSTESGSNAATMEFGGYWTGQNNSIPKFYIKAKTESRGIRLCYEINQ